MSENHFTIQDGHPKVLWHGKDIKQTLALWNETFIILCHLKCNVGNDIIEGDAFCCVNLYHSPDTKD